MGRERGGGGTRRWLLIARFYFISFCDSMVQRLGSSGFDGHVSLLAWTAPRRIQGSVLPRLQAPVTGRPLLKTIDP